MIGIRKVLYHLLKTCTGVLASVFVFICPLAAQQNDTPGFKPVLTDTTKYHKLEEVVVTGQYGESAIKHAVYKVRVIDAKRIQLQGAVNLRDVLTNELNVRITQDPVLGSSVSLQGVGGQNIKVLVDGVPVVGRENGSIDLNQVNMNNVERIELVEGPMSVSFGTDALGGVINIITKKTKQKELKAHAGTYYESIGNYNADAGISAGNKKYSIQLNAGRNFFEGFSPVNNELRTKQWKPREQYLADVTIGRVFEKGSLRWQNNFFNEKVTDRDSGTITPYYAYGIDQYLYTRRITSGLFFDHKLYKDHLLNVVVSYNYYRRVRNTYRKDLVSLNEEITTDPSQQDTNYFHVWMSRGTVSRSAKGKNLNYQTGYEINHETAEGGKITGSNESISDYSLFGSAELRIHNRVTIRPGVRATYNTRFAAPLIPSFNIKWDLSENLKLRASYGKGFRAPSLKELYLEFVDPNHNVRGNKDLKPETGDNVQVFFTYEHQPREKVITLEPSVFYNHIRNMIDLALVSSQTLEAKYVNVNEFTSAGASFNTSFKTPNYSFSAGYSYTGRRNGFANDKGNNKMFFAHEARASASYTYKKSKTILSLFYKFNGKLQVYQYDFINDEVNLSYINPFSLFDASVSQPLWKDRFNITVGSKNMFDVKNVAASMSGGVHQGSSSSAMAGMGRTFFISVRYHFMTMFK